MTDDQHHSSGGLETVAMVAIGIITLLAWDYWRFLRSDPAATAERILRQEDQYPGP
jgi:hypothetical protein